MKEEETPVSPDKNAAPKEAAFTITVPLDRESKQTATFHIKELNEEVFLACKSLVNQDKSFDAVRLMIKSLHVGGDPVEVLKNNFIALNSLLPMFLEIISPINGTLKKN